MNTMFILQKSVCGLCGNYNGNMKDDFETRSKYVAATQLEFINSWKDRPTCMDVEFAVDPCSANPKRKVWAEMSCQVLQKDLFSPCHKLVSNTIVHSFKSRFSPFPPLLMLNERSFFYCRQIVIYSW